MSRSTDFYEILGVSRNFTRPQLRTAYFKLARQYHPDKNPNGLEEFKRIDQAYRVLIHPEKRRAYDLQGSVPEDPGYQFTAEDFYDILRQEIPSEKSPPIRINLDVTLEDVYKGAVKTVEVPVIAPCANCDGVEHNQTITRIGEGNYDAKHLPGDLVFVVKIQDHPKYEPLRGRDLQREIIVSFDEAKRGFKRTLNTLDNRVLSFKHTGTIWDGCRMMIEGEGMPEYFDNYRKGNLYLTFHIGENSIETSHNTSYQERNQVILIELDNAPSKNQISSVPRRIIKICLCLFVLLLGLIPIILIFVVFK